MAEDNEDGGATSIFCMDGGEGASRCGSGVKFCDCGRWDTAAVSSEGNCIVDAVRDTPEPSGNAGFTIPWYEGAGLNPGGA